MVRIKQKKGGLIMSFYQEITPFYDQIFPTNEQTLRFLSICFKGKRNLLDVGAGTGNMAFSLANSGFMVTAIEPEETMIEEIHKKVVKSSNHFQVDSKSMLQLDELTSTFDGIYCIGNTLAHLTNLEEISQFFRQSYQKLETDGIFIIQMVNFKKVLTNNLFSFPIIENNHFSFERKYDLDGEKIQFTTSLKVKDLEEPITNTIPLFPATAEQIIPILESIGFREITSYGKFDFTPYTHDSPALIIVSKK